MKEKIHYVIEAALAVAVVFLFIFQFSGKKESSKDSVASISGREFSENIMPFAYVDIDSLMSNYTFFIDLNEQLARKLENLHADVTLKSRKLDSEVTEFQRKYETNAFMSQERMQQEQNRLLKMKDDLDQYYAQKSQELEEERQRFSEDLRKTIISQIQEYNKNKKYKIIYGKGNDNILYADDVYNITAEFINYINKQHAVSPGTKAND